MTGDVGPYMNDDGDIWVPRTVPYLEARRIAAVAKSDYDDKLVYRGKSDALLLGFARDCQCDEECELAYRWDDETGDEVPTGDDTCRVPAWHFESVERW
jgi:hypothetical protein